MYEDTFLEALYEDLFEINSPEDDPAYWEEIEQDWNQADFDDYEDDI